ncbi:MAG: oligosaccharide flippase family protein [Terriglobales bacterium]
MTYGPFLPLGVLNGMNREVPLLKGKGEPAAIERVRRVTLGFYALVTVVAGMGLFAGACLAKDGITRSAIHCTTILFVSAQFYSYMQCYLVSDTRFREMSRHLLLLAALLPAMGVPLARALGLNGFILGQAATMFVVALLISYRARVAMVPKWNALELRRLVRIGFPIASVGLLWGLLMTVDRWIVLTLLGTTKLGYYSLEIMVFGAVNLLPGIISAQVYPRMAETFGKTGTYDSLKKWIHGQILASTAITLVVVVAIYLVFPPVVRSFLPHYVEGIPAVKIALPGLLFLPVGGAWGNFLNTADKQKYYLAIQAVALPVDVALSVVMVGLGLGINGVALAMTITLFLYSATLLAVGRSILRNGMSRQIAVETVT